LPPGHPVPAGYQGRAEGDAADCRAPADQHVVDEAREAGTEHFIFMTGRNKAVIEDHFDC
jgi:hypothetical protein